MDTTRKLWWGLSTLLIVTFAIMLWMGREIHQQQRTMAVLAVSGDKRLLQPIMELATIGQTGQRIVQPQITDVRLGVLVSRNIGKRRHHCMRL